MEIHSRIDASWKLTSIDIGMHIEPRATTVHHIFFINILFRLFFHGNTGKPSVSHRFDRALFYFFMMFSPFHADAFIYLSLSIGGTALHRILNNKPLTDYVLEWLAILL